NGEASLFEVNIRYVGGLLSAYYLTGEKGSSCCSHFSYHLSSQLPGFRKEMGKKRQAREGGRHASRVPRSRIQPCKAVLRTNRLCVGLLFYSCAMCHPFCCLLSKQNRCNC
ncbi:hypothetical protein CRENBAI_008122, partial [Crenichthys baileyi]